ncbi:MAG: ROK family protein, partial [Cellulosilyticaceae bacterium]
TAIIKQAGEYFGVALTNIMHLFNPDTIVVGGSTSTYKGYMEHALTTAQKHTLTDIYQNCHITSPQDARRIVALGAMAYMQTGMTF